MKVTQEAVATMGTMTRSWRRPLVAAALCALALGQGAGCSSPAGPASDPCIEETLLSGPMKVPANTFLVQPITTSHTGRLQVTVDWVSSVNIVSMVLAQAPCSPEQFGADQCNLILNLFPPPKPLEGATYWLGAGTYDLLLGNFSPVDEVASTEVILRSTGCSPTLEE
jgi:hypothetical protein